MPLFPISLEVEETAVGRVLRKLHSLEGVARIHLNLTKEEPEQVAEVDVSRLSAPMQHHMARAISGPVKFRKDGRINTKGMPTNQNPAYRVVADILNRTPAHIKVLAAALVNAGVTTREKSGAINGYIHRMNLLKLIQRTAPGTYRLSPRGEKIFFGKSAGTGNNGGGWTIDNHKGVRKLLLDTLKESLDNDPDGAGLVSGVDITKIIANAGYSPKNLSTTGMKMRHEGLIEYENGFYSITKAGVAARASLPVQNVEGDLQHNEEEMTANG